MNATAYSQTGCSGSAPAPELDPCGAPAAATSPYRAFVNKPHLSRLLPDLPFLLNLTHTTRCQSPASSASYSVLVLAQHSDLLLCSVFGWSFSKPGRSVSLGSAMFTPVASKRLCHVPALGKFLIPLGQVAVRPGCRSTPQADSSVASKSDSSYARPIGYRGGQGDRSNPSRPRNLHSYESVELPAPAMMRIAALADSKVSRQGGDTIGLHDSIFMHGALRVWRGKICSGGGLLAGYLD